MTCRHALFDPIFKQCIHSDHIAQVLVPTTTCFNLLGLSLFGVQCQMALDLNNTERCFHESAIQWHNIKVNFNSSIIYIPSLLTFHLFLSSDDLKMRVILFALALYTNCHARYKRKEQKKTDKELKQLHNSIYCVLEKHFALHEFFSIITTSLELLISEMLQIMLFCSNSKNAYIYFLKNY